ncbi:ABC transporter ATP-binding protein [Ignavigranum ruoffiae]|uniref:ABC transporter ATP-binding protein n=1 Tax=Ignavigranum ruoffiae TaxID=89093 RepID=UPI002054E82C|nr:ABC transporter ATP-binding protein [Ignavigranum ruoffiae]UPQ85093.1 ABC transporter ATP-binding protein [Ignavigranum ruoffiae]
MEILRIEHLTKIYQQGKQDLYAVNDVSLKVDKGEFIALVGPSGSGKSTFLHMIGGVDSPTSGNIYIEGTNVVTYSEKELALFRRRKVGLIYQFYNLIPNLRVKHNIELPLKLDHRPVDLNFRDELLRKLGIENKLDYFPNELSGGQQQRVAIARSLIYRPAIILADEPTGNLDRDNSQEIIELFKYFNRSLKQTIIIITHDESIALQADRILTFVDGQLVGDDSNG